MNQPVALGFLVGILAALLIGCATVRMGDTTLYCLGTPSTARPAGARP